ncbi:phosphoglycolate phosphatase [Psychrobium sp. 1_MG-2023]|uniref:phosphoglycolate phosphatase n=1 Tax=Psychrobium sp. 1_MG-2023 TaxID=3062624 RepID=UPI000C34AA76|nr:phosphoglycolate phosphatase [Psychrobium sp. 1_MG-2023]MDP2560081.1 phosphoglycolate phosphatase [Psychrobium sp. 1_MG-2023]PKF56260.1 phosphoglycolate phosphatase [Alteromonadales bacterium alter-6D02]
MNFKNKQVVIFDLDGTLVDSAPDLANAINHMLVELGRVPFNQDTIHGWVGNGAQVLTERALSGNQVIDPNLSPELTADALAIFLSAYRANVCVDSQLYAGVKTTMATLAKRGYRLAIVTNKPVEFVAPILKALGLNGVFDIVLGGDSLALKKPDPLPLSHVCQALGVTVEECVMVGDSKNDIVAAKAAGMESVGLTYGYNYGEDIAIYQPELVLSDFSELLNALPHLAVKKS